MSWSKQKALTHHLNHSILPSSHSLSFFLSLTFITLSLYLSGAHSLFISPFSNTIVLDSPFMFSYDLCIAFLNFWIVFLFLRKSWRIKDLNNFLALTQKNLRAESGWYVLWGDNIIVIKYMGLFHISFDLIYRCKNQVLN
jgi:hypothetical protein